MRSLACIVLVLSLTPLAHAATEEEKTERARTHIKAGIAYYDEGRYEDAAKEMRVAYELKPLADLQYDLAQCRRRQTNSTRRRAPTRSTSRDSRTPRSESHIDTQ